MAFGVSSSVSVAALPDIGVETLWTDCQLHIVSCLALSPWSVALWSQSWNVGLGEEPLALWVDCLPFRLGGVSERS